MDVVLLFPGQGSQKPGMGKDLAAAFPEARAAFHAADEALGESLSGLCFEGPAEALTLTYNAQPALLAHSAAAWAATSGALAGRVRAVAGHSLGEFSAYHVAGSIALPDAVRLVRRRGFLMYESGVERPGTMAAVLGDLEEPIERICERASADPAGGLVVPANYNSPGQVVVSGERAGVEMALQLAKGAGAKHAMHLQVSGAFHSPLMRPARDGLAAAIAAVPFANPAFPVYANVTGGPVRSAADAVPLLVEQLTAPVRWTELVRALAAAYPEALFVEMGPGPVLGRLVRKIAPGVQSAACGTAADVEQLLARVS
jgi:[acyl-carrier-protein] S-malonyltransferase